MAGNALKGILSILGTICVLILAKMIIGGAKIGFFMATTDQSDFAYEHVWTVSGDDELYASIDPWPVDPGEPVTLYVDWGRGLARFRVKSPNSVNSEPEWRSLVIKTEVDDDGYESQYFEGVFSFEAGEHEIEFQASDRSGAEHHLTGWKLDVGK